MKSTARRWMDEGMASHVPGDLTLCRICGRNTGENMRWGCEPPFVCDPKPLIRECGWHPVNLTHAQPSCWCSLTDVGVCSSEKIWSCWKGGGDGTGVGGGELNFVASSGPKRRNQYVRHLPALFHQDSLRKQLISRSSFNILTTVWRLITYWGCENTCEYAWCFTVSASE